MRKGKSEEHQRQIPIFYYFSFHQFSLNLAKRESSSGEMPQNRISTEPKSVLNWDLKMRSLIEVGPNSQAIEFRNSRFNPIGQLGNLERIA